MNFYTALEQCIEQGKKFECNIERLKDYYISYDKENDSVFWMNKEQDSWITKLDFRQEYINATYTEFDSTVYMDFISAYKLSKENNTYIKRKNDRYGDAIIIREDEIYLRNCETFTYNVDYNDVIAEDWHIVEDLK